MRAGDQLEVASLIFLLLKKCVVIVPFTRFYVENLEVNTADLPPTSPDAKKVIVSRRFCGTEVIFWSRAKKGAENRSFGCIFWNGGGILSALL